MTNLLFMGQQPETFDRERIYDGTEPRRFSLDGVILSGSDFSLDNGWTRAELIAIAALKVGESLTLHEDDESTRDLRRES